MTEQANNDHRPLLPVRGFGFVSWSPSSWFRANREYTSISNAVSEVESESPVGRSNSAFAASLAEAHVPPAPPNTPPETVTEDTPSVVVTVESANDTEDSDRTHLIHANNMQAESSSMGAGRVQNSSSAAHLQEDVDRTSGAPWPSRITSFKSEISRCSGEQLCLICLEPLTDEEFEIGSAIRLECQCKGEAALRHKDCAQKWVDIKGDRICDVCRAPISNLVEPPPRSEAGSNRNSDAQTDDSRNRYPSPSDVFDCIRMTWVVTIVCVLFFNLDIASALVTGLLVAVMYTWVCQLIRCARYQTVNLMTPSDQEAGFAEQTNARNRVVAAPEILIQ